MKHTLIIAFFFCTMQFVAFSQQNNERPLSFTAVSSAKGVTVRCTIPAERTATAMNVVLYRGNEKNEDVKAINAMNNFAAGAEYTFNDASLANGIYLYTIEISTGNEMIERRTALAYVYPPGTEPSINTVDTKVKPQSDEVRVSWKINNAMLAGNISLMRSRNYDRNYETVAELKNNETGYIDHLNEANETFYYKLQVADRRTGEVLNSPVALALAAYTIQPRRPQQVRVSVRKNVPVISWISDDEYARGFYVSSRGNGEKNFRRVSAFIQRDSTCRYTWLDEAAAKNPGKTLDYVVMSESNSNTASKPSDTVSIAVPAEETDPVPPSHVRIIAAGDAINISWDIDSADLENSYTYVVYEQKSDARDFRPVGDNSSDPDKNFATVLKPSAGSAYTVRSVRAGKESVSATPVIYRGKAVAGFGPVYLKGEVIDDALNISWSKDETNTIKEYRLYKWQNSKFVLAETIPAGNTSVITKTYVPGQLNIYQLKAVDRGNIESAGSKPLQMN